MITLNFLLHRQSELVARLSCLARLHIRTQCYPCSRLLDVVDAIGKAESHGRIVAFFAAGSTLDTLSDASKSLSEAILQLGAAASVAGALGVHELQRGMLSAGAKIDLVADEVRK